ncbi:MAG: DUF3556 domain-containing protein [Polyangia bacterium]
MGLLQPTRPPYDPVVWRALPFAERARMVCESWAVQGYGTPVGAYVFYALKVGFYVWMWRVFTGPVPWLSPIAFEKAIVWSMLFEGLGLGCGSGPLTGRYYPPFGGFLYWLRPGTTKLSMLGGRTRTWLDVALYVALVACSLRALLSPVMTSELLLPLVILVPIIGILDRTIFLALRAEHYFTTIVVLTFAHDWIGGAKCVQLALWFFAGFSKLNHHFPSVVGVMISNSPLARFPWFRRLMYRSYPSDLHASKVATWMGHAGTLLELSVPIVVCLASPGPSMLLAMALVIGLHVFITSNVPMGVPIEWNFMVVYGAFALFWAHPEVSPLSVSPWPVAVFLGVMLLIIPLVGNLFPSKVSFLLAMRYYAGNWPYTIWLFRGETYRKLAACKTSAAWVYDQLDRFYDRPTSIGLVGKVMAFRLMHLHGRALSVLLPKAVDRLEDYEYLDGELVAGMILGWNFGDGHLHNEQLLGNVQAQCGFSPGELRCIFVEPQALGGDSLAYRIRDAATGELARGKVLIDELRARQAWVSP